MVDAQDVRDVLAKLSTLRVHDDTINKQIGLANTIVENESADGILEATLESARLVIATHLTLAAYAAKLERSVGAVPAEVASQLAFWKTQRDIHMGYIKRDTPTIQPMADQPETLAEQYVSGDLEGDYY
ncbi:MAG: hypothetical protein AM326_03025 [Candidatus Thorarchaeota archaeon SMTZ-45]|nr:MAG: hypothetical protein AM326_03025 [Candidatus Thorarchaeota archaeon SMTZ-45]